MTGASCFKCMKLYKHLEYIRLVLLTMYWRTTPTVYTRTWNGNYLHISWSCPTRQITPTVFNSKTCDIWLIFCASWRPRIRPLEDSSIALRKLPTASSFLALQYKIFLLTVLTPIIAIHIFSRFTASCKKHTECLQTLCSTCPVVIMKHVE